MNPHLASIRGNDPICLKFGGWPVVVWKVFGKLSVGCFKGVWGVSMEYPNGMWGV